MAAVHPAFAYLYTYDGITGKLSSERVRVPGEHRPLSPLKPATSAGAQSATVRTLDQDVPLLVEVVHVGDGDGDVTIFKSVGVGVQDAAIACAVVERAVKEKIGVVVEDYDEDE
ncbi:hypothetical protein NUW54_g204 [Trametes sanguinea]|uniref:Uncharacterized protein n=1 Tax=Trametes sanguinea TaxID=158606 RepID=A0ACC1QCB2_9APHY|nr:hypothetical protein NUW54_g204 [Trametes sanguinea]